MAALEAHGVCREQVKLVFPGDYSPELFRLDFYGVATGETAVSSGRHYDPFRGRSRGKFSPPKN